MFHALHYDIAFYPRGHRRHPGPLSHQHVFAALTPRGLERLTTAPFGNWTDERLCVADDEDASDVMDHIEGLEVHVSS